MSKSTPDALSMRLFRYLPALLLLAGLASPALAAGPRVRIETTLGVIVVELNREQAPITVANFLDYTRRGWYDGTLFHRTIASSLIQGGGFLADLKLKKPGDTIINEAGNGLSNVRGTMAMARRPEPHTAAAQFFINLADNTPYDHRDNSTRGWGYCVFGRVVEGIEVADAIGAVRVHHVDGFDNNVPVDPVVITSLRLIEE